VPRFVLEWWKNGAPDRMKLDTPMSLFFLLISKNPSDQARLRRPTVDPLRSCPISLKQAVNLRKLP
jgi:hypothetical protein